MAKDDPGSNGRVTMAVLATKLDNIQELLKTKCTEQDVDHDRISTLEGEVKRVNDRVSGWAAIQTGVAVVLSTVAGYLGTRN